MHLNPEPHRPFAARQQQSQPAPLAISMGDPAGIGPEIVLKALSAIEKLRALGQRKSGFGQPSKGFEVRLFGDPGWLKQLGGRLGLDHWLDAATWIQWEQACFVPAGLRQGVASAAAGQCAVDSVLAAAQGVLSGSCRALVTAPLNKQAMHLAGHPYPGHTELLSELSGNCPVRMMLEHPKLRTVLHSIHMSLRQAIDALHSEALRQTILIADQSLARLLGRRPRLLLAALNPHAGEAGAFGREEIDLLIPCAEQAQAEGIQIEGPLAADSVFARAWDNPDIDAVIALYHDQGLIPIKLFGIDQGVNITLGLPFIRSSPDHGTAFDIAGRGIAREHSLLEALWAADRYSEAPAQENR